MNSTCVCFAVHKPLVVTAFHQGICWEEECVLAELSSAQSQNNKCTAESHISWSNTCASSVYVTCNNSWFPFK